MRALSGAKSLGLLRAVALAALLVLAGCGEQADAPEPADGRNRAERVVSSETPILIPAAVPPALEPTPAPRELVRWSADGPMSGTWHGGWSFYGRSVEGAATITLRHYDESFNGYVEMTPDVGAVCGKTSGTIVWGLQFDDYVTFGFYDLWAYGFTFHGTLRDNVLAGEFLAITQCGAESGTFRVKL